MKPLHSLPEGYRLSDYRIDECIAAGGFGLVYAATDTNLHARVVIKEYMPNDLSVRDTDRVTVHAKSTGDTGTYQWGLDRFIDEARLLAKIRHPNVVRVYRVLTANRTAYMVMEDGGPRTLRAILDAVGTLNQAQALALLEPLLAALECIHAQGILHRDLKPENILIRDDDSPVLIDFGSARQQVGSRTRPLTAVVSPGYAPAEQYDSASPQGPYTDLYALGAVFYEGLTGRAPQESMGRSLNDRIACLEQTLAGRYDAGLLRAIDAALRFRPEARPASVAAFRALLGAKNPPKPPPPNPIATLFHAAEAGDVEAQFQLGLRYYEGRDLGQDDVQAVRWFRQAAERGHPGAQAHLGWMYSQGRGVARAPGEALRWFHQGANQGHPYAQYCLGIMHENGQGITQDTAEALAWYRKAAAQGFSDAAQRVARLEAEQKRSAGATARGRTRKIDESVKAGRGSGSASSSAGHSSSQTDSPADDSGSAASELNGVSRHPLRIIITIAGVLLAGFGLIDFVGSYIGLDVWNDWIGIDLPELIWSFTAWIEMFVGFSLVGFASKKELADF